MRIGFNIFFEQSNILIRIFLKTVKCGEILDIICKLNYLSCVPFLWKTKNVICDKFPWQVSFPQNVYKRRHYSKISLENVISVKFSRKTLFLWNIDKRHSSDKFSLRKNSSETFIEIFTSKTSAIELRKNICRQFIYFQ